MTKVATTNQLLKVDTELTTEQVQKFFTATPPEKIRERPAKGGGNWKYVEGGYVTQVLNSLFGFNWSFEVVTTMQEALATAATGTVVVQGRLRVKIGDEWITKEQYGRKEVAYKKNTSDPLDFGNDMKAAATDAKKKCASELGLFADIYSQDELLEIKIVNKLPVDMDEKLAEDIKSASTEEELQNIMQTLSPEYKRAYMPAIKNKLEEIRNGNRDNSPTA